jgi:2-polyprenyl-3-methyl-5-hydroxy-6-metoxy-1,4-benzoquinol methylase
MSEGLSIPYRRVSEYIPVDVARLRPRGAYRSLLEKRTHAIDGLIARYGRIPPDLLIDRPCPTCGGATHRPELRKDHLAIVRCADCDLVFVNPAFDEAHYRAVYRSADYQEIMRDLGIASHDYRVARFGTERVAIMSRYLRAAGGGRPAYLDVGCSTGFVVEAARDRGWEAIGIDLNPSAIAFGCGRGLDLRNASLEDAGFEPERFDAVSLFDVLEHLLDPRAIVDRCAALLKPGGILFLYVPNYDSASRLLMGPEAHFIWPTHHLNYYTPATLRDLMARRGLEVELTATEGLDIADYIWHRREVARDGDLGALERVADTLQFLINAGCYGKNLRVLARKP